MAIKIYKQGKPQKDIIYHGYCRDCGCKFTFQKEDARTSSDPRDSGVLTINCPQTGCEKELYIQL